MPPPSPPTTPTRSPSVFKQTPAVHRFPGSMAARVQSLCAAIEQDWGGDAAAIWTQGDPDGATVLKRLRGLPGFGEQKAKIFLALLGKQYGFTGAGWREAAGAYGEEGSFRSVADIVSPESLDEGARAQARDEGRRQGRLARPAKLRNSHLRDEGGAPVHFSHPVCAWSDPPTDRLNP